MVYYRKYRPQTLGELIGQDNVKQTLKKAFEGGKLAHAYLFSGPRGTGKTSTARILAKMVNCELADSKWQIVNGSDKKTISNTPSAISIPCNKCSSCLSITDGSNLDLIEIDAASNRGIDDIRELREKIKLAPTASNKKVYIIDEVHMLTNEAFNALLKTLEEPPSHVLFILATTEPHKIPQTILSRVQRLDFKNATETELLSALEQVAKKEQLEIEKGALLLIAKKSEGSFRDSLKLLDQLASLNQKITGEVVEEMFKSGKFEVVLELIESISQKDSAKALQIVESQTEEGINIKEFINSTMDILRSMLLIKHKAINSVKDLYDEDKFNLMITVAEKFSSARLINVLELFNRALEKMKTSSIPSLPLEVAVVESCTEENQESRIKNQESRELVVVPNPSSPQTAPGPQSDEKKQTPKDDAISSDMATILDKWTYILETVKPYNFSLEAMLRQVKVLSCEDGVVLFEVPYSFHQRIMEAPKSRNLLESVLTDVLGKQAKVKCRLGVKPVKVEELANVEVAEDDEIIRVAAEIFNSDTLN
ncbi:DNA polymerase III subunit gamma/tau [Candidatus Daviesbacteria bacterium]|nr:DNA polymerase III subunit gamma/tau [Candidatus Daviesbacteria bacterium]